MTTQRHTQQRQVVTDADMQWQDIVTRIKRGGRTVVTGMTGGGCCGGGCVVDA